MPDAGATRKLQIYRSAGSGNHLNTKGLPRAAFVQSVGIFRHALVTRPNWPSGATSNNSAGVFGMRAFARHTDNRSTLPSTAFGIRIREANTSGLKLQALSKAR
jgi:hypothetical protein